ncbi:MAG TPA: S8 family serine peptidase [Steroidobacteraceae bacterium]|jgi:subtilisin family serine protease
MNTRLRLILAAAIPLLMSACASLPIAPRTPALPQDARVQSSNFIVVTVRNVPRAQAQRAGSTPRGYDQAGAYGITAEASKAVRALERAYGLQQVSAWPIPTLRVHCIVFRLPPATERTALLAQLEHDPRVETAQPLNEFGTETVGENAAPADVDPQARKADSALSRPAWMPYNDPYAPLQRALRELDVIEAQQQSRGAGVRIAIIDTGVDLNHPDLKGRILAHRNFVDADERQFLEDHHGTEVAGVIAAVANNGIGIVGIAPDAQLLAFKACWQSPGDAARAVCNSFTLAQGLEAAILAHADIVNLSLAGPPDPLLASLVSAGERQGMLFTGAVPASTAEGFPAAVTGVLAVESVEDGPWRAGDLLAPGHEILTLMPGGHYDFASGSSLATAEVSGILALMISEHGRIPADSAAQMLTRSARDTAARSPSGLVNACRALIEASRRDGCSSHRGSVAEDVRARSPESR